MMNMHKKYNLPDVGQDRQEWVDIFNNSSHLMKI